MGSEREESQTGLIFLAVLAIIGVTAVLFGLRSEEPAPKDVRLARLFGCYTAEGHPPLRITASSIQLIGHSPPRRWSMPPAGSPSTFTIPFGIEGDGEARSLVYDPANPSTITGSDFVSSRGFRGNVDGVSAGTLTITESRNGQSQSMVFRRAPLLVCENG